MPPPVRPCTCSMHLKACRRRPLAPSSTPRTFHLRLAIRMAHMPLTKHPNRPRIINRFATRARILLVAKGTALASAAAEHDSPTRAAHTTAASLGGSDSTTTATDEPGYFPPVSEYFGQQATSAVPVAPPATAATTLASDGPAPRSVSLAIKASNGLGAAEGGIVRRDLRSVSDDAGLAASLSRMAVGAPSISPKDDVRGSQHGSIDSSPDGTTASDAIVGPRRASFFESPAARSSSFNDPDHQKDSGRSSKSSTNESTKAAIDIRRRFEGDNVENRRASFETGDLTKARQLAFGQSIWSK